MRTASDRPKLHTRRRRVTAPLPPHRTRPTRQNTLERAFSGRTGRAAGQTLVEGAPCPVCGSTHHPAKAQLPHTAPTQAQVDAAKQAAEKADRLAQNASAAAQSALAAVNEGRAPCGGMPRPYCLSASLPRRGTVPLTFNLLKTALAEENAMPCTRHRQSAKHSAGQAEADCRRKTAAGSRPAGRPASARRWNRQLPRLTSTAAAQNASAGAGTAGCRAAHSPALPPAGAGTGRAGCWKPPRRPAHRYGHRRSALQTGRADRGRRRGCWTASSRPKPLAAGNLQEKQTELTAARLPSAAGKAAGRTLLPNRAWNSTAPPPRARAGKPWQWVKRTGLHGRRHPDQQAEDQAGSLHPDELSRPHPCATPTPA